MGIACMGCKRYVRDFSWKPEKNRPFPKPRQPGIFIHGFASGKMCHCTDTVNISIFNSSSFM
jgi:hypothetical protein